MFTCFFKDKKCAEKEEQKDNATTAYNNNNDVKKHQHFAVSKTIPFFKREEDAHLYVQDEQKHRV